MSQCFTNEFAQIFAAFVARPATDGVLGGKEESGYASSGMRRRSLRRILPVGFFGISLRNVTARTFL